MNKLKALFKTRQGRKMLTIAGVTIGIPVLATTYVITSNNFIDIDESAQTTPTIDTTNKTKASVQYAVEQVVGGWFAPKDVSGAEGDEESGQVDNAAQANSAPASEYDPSSAPSETPAQPSGVDPVINGNDKPAMVARLLKEMGYCSEEIAGIMGNISIEAGGFNEAARNGDHIGLCQWEGGRRADINAGIGTDAFDGNNDFNEQLEGLKWEIPNKYPKVVPGALITFSDAESGSGNVASCTDGFCKIFEGCTGTYGNYATINGRNYQGLEDRRNNAQNFYNQLVNGEL